MGMSTREGLMSTLITVYRFATTESLDEIHRVLAPGHGRLGLIWNVEDCLPF